jgi:flavin reductase (DIM6/NTAB) family NADH-FMN oxidoreductase RutF
MVAFDRDRRIVPTLRRTGRYAVNVLGEDQQALSDCFAGGPRPRGDSPADHETSGGAAASGDRGELCGAAWRAGGTGLPVLDAAIASLECTVVDVHRAGDHDLFIARVDAALSGDDQTLPLLYYSGRYLRIERASLHDLEGKPEG